MPQNIQPMGLVGSREAISAPTVANASESTPVSTAKANPGLSPATPAGITSPVRKSSKRASPTSATHTAHSDQANRAAVRRLIPPTSCPGSLDRSVTIPLYSTAVSYALRSALRNSFLARVSGTKIHLPQEQAMYACILETTRGFFEGVCTPSNATANFRDPPPPRNTK
jgi:hypothetical protein